MIVPFHFVVAGNSSAAWDPQTSWDRVEAPEAVARLRERQAVRAA
ncbi:MAG: hypothetical protein R3F62_06480 [Planctomycetota bacterium]